MAPFAAAVSKGTESQIGPGFGQVLLELIETERTYMAGLDALLQSYRPALQPLAPSVLAPVFIALDAIHVTSEELLGKVEFILEGYLLHAEHAASAPPSSGGAGGWAADREQWAAAALAEAFVPKAALQRALSSTPHGAMAPSSTSSSSAAAAVAGGSAAESEHHPLYRYRSYVNHYEHALRGLASLMGVSAFAKSVHRVASQLGQHAGLQDLLITPIQRPPRYLMLLERAYKCFDAQAAPPPASTNAETDASPAPTPTPVGNARAALLAASEVVRSLVSNINEAKRESDAFERVSLLQRRLGGGAILEHPCRRFVASGELASLQKGGAWGMREVHLFNDMLLLGTSAALVPPDPTASSRTVSSSASAALSSFGFDSDGTKGPHEASRLHVDRIAQLTPSSHVVDASTPSGLRQQLLAVSSIMTAHAGTPLAAAGGGKRVRRSITRLGARLLGGGGNGGNGGNDGKGGNGGNGATSNMTAPTTGGAMATRWMTTRTA